MEKIFKNNSLSLFLGKKQTGKSFMMKYLLYTASKRNRFDYVIIISPTSFNGDWDVIPESFIYQTMDDAFLENLFEIQKNNNSSLLLILDDTIGTVKHDSPKFQTLATSGRHFRISVFASFQHYKKAPTFLRSNAENIFVFKQHNQLIVENMFFEWGFGNFKTKHEFMEYIRKNTQNYNVVYIDVNNDKFFVVRAKDVGKFYLEFGSTNE